MNKQEEIEYENYVKEEWMKMMVKELSTEKKLRLDLLDYYNLIQTNSELIYILSNGVLSKPNYTIEVFKEFLEKNYTKKTEKEIMEDEDE